MQRGREGDQGQGDPRRRRRRRSRRRRSKGKVDRHGHRRPRGRALRLEQHDRVPLQAEERADEDRREELHRRRRRVPGRLVRDRGAVPTWPRSTPAVEAARADGARRCRPLPTVADARRRLPRVAIYSSWSGTQEIGWVPLRVRPVRHSVRPDLQGARREGQPARRLRRDRHADAARRTRGGASRRRPRARCRT